MACEGVPQIVEDSTSRRFWIVQSKDLASPVRTASHITSVEYGTLQDAYDHFNAVLFDGALPQVLITLQRHARARGYFSAKRFQRRDSGREHVHEVALNPDCFNGRSDEEILSTLAHEMVHVWQQEYGHPGRGRYHNREWARRMHAIGLMPSTTGQPGGKTTGETVTHYILEGGSFQAACRTFLRRCRLIWQSAANKAAGERAVAGGTDKTPTRAKFTCPNCRLNAWAKPEARLACQKCSQECRELVLMVTN
jgi:predicted SprT family Zn-dependent metalloprotease